MAKLEALPGGPQFVACCEHAVASTGLAFAGEPDDKVLAHLESGRPNFEADLLDIGAPPYLAAKFCDVFIAAVMSRKAEIEAMPRGWA
jgi:hypothetical protein